MWSVALRSGGTDRASSMSGPPAAARARVRRALADNDGRDSNSRETQAARERRVAPDPPDLLIEIVVIHGQPPPQAEADLVPGHGAEGGAREPLAGGKDAGGAGERAVDHEREHGARAEEH